MAEFLEAISKTPVPIILILAGLIFLAFAIFEIDVDLGKVKITKPTSRRRMGSAVVGAILLAVGVALSRLPPPPSAAIGPSETPSAEILPENPTEAPAPAAAQESPTDTLGPPTSSAVPTELSTKAEPAPPSEAASTIAISEVEASPCLPKGKTDGPPSSNEFVELYNYGAQPIDVGGWWLATNGGGRPQKIVSWDYRNPGAVPEHYQVLTRTTEIPSLRFALILSPLYQTGDPGMHEPYVLPEGTIILTVQSGKYLGNDHTGLLGNVQPLTVMLLYVGTDARIEQAISTYGTPRFSDSPTSLQDDGLDLLPLSVQDCHSAARIDPAGPDTLDNWHVVRPPTPGAP
jgi:hypothetical protein